MAHEDVLVSVGAKGGFLLDDGVCDVLVTEEVVLVLAGRVYLVLVTPVARAVLRVRTNIIIQSLSYNFDNNLINDHPSRRQVDVLNLFSSISTAHKTDLVVFELHDGVEELVAGVAQPVPVLDHVGVQVDGGGETPVTDVASHILVI